jgi:hypothetical protein
VTTGTELFQVEETLKYTTIKPPNHDVGILWFFSLNLARSTRDLLETMETIREAGGRFQSISEPWADTTSLRGK